MPSTAVAARESIERLSVLVPDFPREGVLFRDLAPVLSDGAAFRAVIDALVEPFASGIDVVIGVEARGFVLAAAAAYSLGLGTGVIRKAGKLPGEVIAESYSLEYGEATLELQPENLPSGCRVLLVDDVLATGGTLAAATALIERAGWTVSGIAVVVELEALGARDTMAGRDIHSLVVG